MSDLPVMGTWAEWLETQITFHQRRVTLQELRTYAIWWASLDESERCVEDDIHCVTAGRKRCPHGVKG